MTHDADRTPDEIRTWLARIADLAVLLPAALITRHKPDAGGRPTPASKPPVNLGVLHLLDTDDKPTPTMTAGMGWAPGMQFVDPDSIGLLPYLDGWVRDMATTLMDEHPDMPDEVPEVPTVIDCLDWLTRHAEAAATTRQWPELVYGLRTVLANVREATADVADVAQRPVPCSRCGEALRQVGEQSLWECDNGHQTRVEAVSLSTAHKLVNDGAKPDQRISLSTLKGWSRRPGLLPCLRESQRISYYDLGTIRKLVAEWRLRRAG